jgi:V/A-type H+-transporting ATPase subunit A
VVKTFWGLDSKLAYARHYPAINWLTSYTLYYDNIEAYLRSDVAEDYPEVRDLAMDLLQQEAKLEELVRLVGADSLSNREQLILLVAKSIREDFLFQNAFDNEDARTPLKKQYYMLKAITTVYTATQKLLSNEGFEIASVKELPILHKVSRVKEIAPEDEAAFEKLIEQVQSDIAALA